MDEERSLSKSSSLLSSKLVFGANNNGQRRESKGLLPSLSKLGHAYGASSDNSASSSPISASPYGDKSVGSPSPPRREKSSKSLADGLDGGGVMRSASSWTQGILKRPMTASGNGIIVGDSGVMEEARQRLRTIEQSNSNLRRMAGHPDASLSGRFKSRFQHQKTMEHEQDEEAASFELYGQSKEASHGLLHSLGVRDYSGYSGSFGSQKELMKRLETQNNSVVNKNPEAFSEDAAALTDLARVMAVDDAKYRLEMANANTTEPEKVNEFKEALLGISVARPFFVAPTPERKQPREKVEREAPKPTEEKVWQTTLDNRVQESESGSMFDTEEVRLLQFDLDWIRVSQKARFRRAVSLNDDDGGDKEAYSDELFEVYKEALLHKNELRSIFNYYGCKDGPMESEYMWQMTLSSWLVFCDEAQVLSDQRGCKKDDLQRIFLAVNFEEDDGAAPVTENDVNDDNKMLRFEFIEGIVRAAFGKFITTGLMNDASEAVRNFVKVEVLDRVPPVALLDPNKFREERLYVREVDDFFAVHEHLFLGCFKLYKAHWRTKYFSIEHWTAFLHSLLLIGPHIGVSRSDAKLVFMSAAALISDELKNRKRSVALLFYDFLEAFARLTDLISPNSLEALQSSAPQLSPELKPRDRHLGVMKGVLEFGDKPANKLLVPLPKPGISAALTASQTMTRRQGVNSESAGYVEHRTRPLIEKLEIMFDFIFPQLKAAWGGKTENDVAERMIQEAKKINGGRELA